MTAEHESIAFEVGEILGSLETMCAVVPKHAKAPKGRKKRSHDAASPSVSPWAGFASKTFVQLFRVTDPASAADELCREVQRLPELKGRSEFISHIIMCCCACSIAVKSGSWRALAAAHRERGNAAAVFSAAHEHLHRMAVMRDNGGRGRGKANDALRQFVESEAREKHSEKSAHAAGNEISRRFDPLRNDLSLANFGKPNVTFENTPNRFAQWIREAREGEKSSTVA